MCYVFNQGSSSTFSGVSDSGSHVYSVMTALHQSSNSNTTTQGFYFQLASTITTTTVTLGSGTASGLAIACNTATGVTPTSPIDGSCSGNGTNSSYSCATASGGSGPITTSRNGAYLYCDAANDDNNDTISPGAGFTAGAGYTGSNFNFVTQFQVQATAGATTPTFTALYNNDSAMDCTALKPPMQTFTFAAGCFDSLATGAWTTTTAGNIENAITASSGSSYHWCYWPGVAKWTVK